MSPDSGIPSPSPSQLRTKDRVPLKLRVCDSCRTKKTKCDMGTPTCSSCTLRQTLCTYSKYRQKPGPPKRRLNSAHSRTTSVDNAASPSVHTQTPGQDFREYTIPDELSVQSAVPELSLWDDSGFSALFSNTPPSSLSLFQPVISEPQRCSDLKFETEEFLLEVYIQHVQPLYPLLRRSKSPSTSHDLLEMPLRLRMAIYAVSSRFVPPDCSSLSVSPDEFARRATRVDKCSSLDMNELKASILLCVHSISSDVSWDAVGEIARISRMADHYHDQVSREKHNAGGMSSCDTEEWRSVWWCIYSLDTFFSAISDMSPIITDRSLEAMMLPAMSLHDFTNNSCAELGHDGVNSDMQLTLSPGSKHWETMSLVFARSPCRGRNLYLGACSLMRSVTSFKSSARQDYEKNTQARLQALESDCTAATFSLPAWVFNPTQNLAVQETDSEHRDRLDTLLVWQGACLALSAFAGQLDGFPSGEQSELHGQWQATVSKANEILRVIRNWKPDYFRAVDTQSSYLVLITGFVLLLNSGLQSAVASCDSSSGHIDLLLLFLNKIGRYWPLTRTAANRLAEVLKEARRNPPSCPTVQSAFEYLAKRFLGGQLLDFNVFACERFQCGTLETKSPLPSSGRRLSSGGGLQSKPDAIEWDTDLTVPEWDLLDALY